ncbi:cupin domain-containing protein [Pseudonocardia sp. KRD291]|uniref:cupin domain-containing protein n=1 Tax=Pseudonocardia sp. KRD291 TaxID=2792007 RepID=UPI001C4A7129|nr:cupin domain-containing protein [Pseudonocardia sp. KRD291]MBW0101889.1 cupin domain-containing protein [Pseudonocardia sp. KRD291]
MRRVITGIDDAGKSIVISDTEVPGVRPPVLGGATLIDLFGEDAIPTVPNDGSHDESRRYFPAAPEGYRFTVFSYPPQGAMTVPDDLDAAIAESARLAPGLEDAVASPDGWHYTATVDLEYVIEGEFTLYLDEGASTTLHKGDSIVHCGEKHSWVNTGNTQATMLLVFIGARQDEARFGPYKIEH